MSTLDKDKMGNSQGNVGRGYSNDLTDRVAFVRAGGMVKRYHTAFTIATDTVGHHSYHVATIVDALFAGAPSVASLRAALYHDTAEHIYGDIPSPAKRMMDSAQLRSAEDELMELRGLFVELNPLERWAQKLADILDGLYFCAEELKRGNLELLPIFERYHSYFHDHLDKPFRQNLPRSESEEYRPIANRAFDMCNHATRIRNGGI